MIPALFLTFFLKIYGMISAFFISFQKIEFTPILRYTYVGLHNWIELLSDPVFAKALQVTSYFSLLTIIIGIVLALGIALLLNENFRGRGMLRVLLLVPWAVPHVSNAQIWRWLFSIEYGIINGALIKFGLSESGIPWLIDSRVAIHALVIAQTWKDVPFMALLLLAALQTVPEQLHEAAKIDGASFWHRFRNVTLAHIRTTVFFVIIIEMIEMFKVFDIVYVATHGEPANSTMVLYLYIYRQVFEYVNFGYGAAVAYTLAAVVVVISLFYIKIFTGREQLWARAQ